MDFSNQTVVVTGGTGALGIAVVNTLLDAGARCVVPYINDAEAKALAQHERLQLVRCDLSDEAQVAALYSGITDLSASIHIAGGFAFAPIAESDKEVLMRMVNMNLVSTYLCCREAVRAFGERQGRIVNVASRQALEPRAGKYMTAYTASKAAVAALTQALAAEVAPRILVSAVAPSIIDTPANRTAMPDADYTQWPKPAEIASGIVFLASGANQLASGAIVPIYGAA
ncbi:SDR family oxidoreductase [Noviherbaspirillum saxi]|uniref:SDR family oxidoreductase n=1 Tax=Noviherbaspirillum saxi TaxID=2320863 RepID=A0A3A3FLF8_9BURK|nr:SDR family NAD(P)-dependent oxidoreductase [Noviherbaspirillum saxi]RJF96137.1 SDR family oxidoreductase [Noviherbaspirillum saxi]